VLTSFAVKLGYWYPTDIKRYLVCHLVNVNPLVAKFTKNLKLVNLLGRVVAQAWSKKNFKAKFQNIKWKKIIPKFGENTRIFR